MAISEKLLKNLYLLYSGYKNKGKGSYFPVQSSDTHYEGILSALEQYISLVKQNHELLNDEDVLLCLPYTSSFESKANPLFAQCVNEFTHNAGLYSGLSFLRQRLDPSLKSSPLKIKESNIFLQESFHFESKVIKFLLKQAENNHQLYINLLQENQRLEDENIELNNLIKYTDSPRLLNVISQNNNNKPNSSIPPPPPPLPVFSSPPSVKITKKSQSPVKMQSSKSQQTSPKTFFLPSSDVLEIKNKLKSTNTFRLINLRYNPVEVPFSQLVPMLKNGKGIIRFHEQLFYADASQDKIEEIFKDYKNQQWFSNLKEICLSENRLANIEEVMIINSLLKLTIYAPPDNLRFLQSKVLKHRMSKNESFVSIEDSDDSFDKNF